MDKLIFKISCILIFLIQDNEKQFLGEMSLLYLFRAIRNFSHFDILLLSRRVQRVRRNFTMLLLITILYNFNDTLRNDVTYDLISSFL